MCTYTPTGACHPSTRHIKFHMSPPLKPLREDIWLHDPDELHAVVLGFWSSRRWVRHICVVMPTSAVASLR
jgi:hypothetical protein